MKIHVVNCSHVLRAFHHLLIGFASRNIRGVNWRRKTSPTSFCTRKYSSYAVDSSFSVALNKPRMTFGLIELLITALLVSLGIYYHLTWTFDFWTSRGVIGPKPGILFGNAKNHVTVKCAFATWIRGFYEEYPDEPMIGIFRKREPILIVNDMELIKTILIRDFNNFTDRGFMKVDIHEPLSRHLFLLKAKTWRPLRQKLSPVFTSGKLREMFYLINQCGDQLEKYLEKDDGQCIDMRDIAGKYATDVIGLCAFGVEANALKNEDSIFRKMGNKIFQVDWKIIIKFRLMEFAPLLYKLFGGWFTDPTVRNFFVNLIRDTVKYREENNIVRNDYVDLLRALRDDPSKIDDIEMTDSLMAAQLFAFFIAGFETSSSTISNCLFELSMNHRIQDELREEIRIELAKTDGKLTYEGIQKMKYLDKVVNETLRKYPTLPILMRQAAAAYTFPGTSINIPAGTKILIPIHAIQRDSRYFPEPETFNPENFTDDAIKKRPEMSFLSFGDGPRNCIGARFGRIKVKVGLVKVLQKFSVDVCDKTDKKYELLTTSFTLRPANGIVLRVNRCVS